MPMATRQRRARSFFDRAIPLVLVASVACLSAPLIASERSLNDSMNAQVTMDRDSQRSQVRVTQLSDQTSELLGEYRVTMQQLDRVTVYNNQLQALVADQESELASIDTQLEDFEVVEQEIVPLMLDMIQALETFIELDVPFLLDERRARVARLRDLMGKSDVTVSEKYRQIMDAYTIETNFSRDIEAYRGKQTIDGTEYEVSFLRVGRILLAWQTDDRERSGFYNGETGEWQELPSSYNTPITQGLRIARKQAPPDLLQLPVSAAEVAK